MTEEHDIRPDLIAHQKYVSLRLPIEDRIVLIEAMERLADLQRQVVYYLFYQDLTQSEVAKRLGVSQRHVSRLLAAALRHLANRFARPASGRPRPRRKTRRNGEEIDVVEGPDPREPAGRA